MIYQKIEDLIGHTPILKLNHLTDSSMSDIYVKLEFYNPGNSIKDRAAAEMIRSLEESGQLSPGMTIIEPTSGNTGISAAMLAAAKGYRLILVMPDTMSAERRQILSAYGAELVLTDGSQGMKGALEKTEELVREKGYLTLAQFSNPSNALAHEKTTALEIIEDFEQLDAFVSGIGTGGTLSGNAKTLKAHYPDIRIVGVEPEESAVISGHPAGPHKIQGIGAGFIPSILDQDLLNETMTVSDSEAFEMTSLLAKKEGLFLGISSGAALAASLRLAKQLGKGKKILTIAPDSGHKYLSTPGLFY